MNEPIGNALYGPLLARLPLGAYFLLAGYAKLQNPDKFVMVVKKFGILPEPLATLYAILLPYVETISGGMLILGAWTTLFAILMSLMLASFIIAIGLFEGMPFNKDLVLLGLSLSFLWSGSGACSIDRFRKTG